MARKALGDFETRRVCALAFFLATTALVACSGIGSPELDDGGAASDSGNASDGSSGDASTAADGSRGGRDGGGANDSGTSGDDAGTTCTGVNQCDATHSCSDKQHCCAPLPGAGGCGFCSIGVCPG